MRNQVGCDEQGRQAQPWHKDGETLHTQGRDTVPRQVTLLQKPLGFIKHIGFTVELGREQD